ncbi:MAG TPA: LytTR family DNA-binding domain-containing protein [Longimicrobiales bacterium]
MSDAAGSAIRALIVDDEPLAREMVRARLESEPDVEIVGEAEDGPAAVAAITALRPDIVFLDIQMPEMDGFEVLERTAAHHLPIIVFVTAYDEYALRAFDVHALDYLLKPFTAERFARAMRRARHEAMRSDAAVRRALARLLDSRDAGSADAADCGRTAGANAASGPARRFVVKRRDSYLLVKADDLVWIEAAGDYVRLHCDGESHLLRATMADMEARLDAARFRRIHRSAIVNLDRVAEIRPADGGAYTVVLEGGTTLRMSRGYRDNLFE